MCLQVTHSPEEDDECVGLRECEEDECEEGGDCAVEDGGPDLGEGVGGALAAGAEGDDVGVGDVRVVVDAEADHQHDGHARDRVDGQAPKEGRGGNSLENSTQRESLNEKVTSFSIALTASRGFLTPFNCDLNCLPEVDESDDVDEREGDADEDEEAAAEVGEEEERDDDDRQEGQPDVAPQLVPDHLVRLPLGVFLKEGEPNF